MPATKGGTTGDSDPYFKKSRPVHARVPTAIAAQMVRCMSSRSTTRILYQRVFSQLAKKSGVVLFSVCRLFPQESIKSEGSFMSSEHHDQQQYYLANLQRRVAAGPQPSRLHAKRRNVSFTR